MRLTLYGMYSWDETLFDGIVLPAGMDRQYLIDYIISEAGDLYPYYQVPPKIKQLTQSWFARKLANFQRMYSALIADYNPLENYDRREEGYEAPDITNTETPNITRVRERDSTMGRDSTSGQTSESHVNGVHDEVGSASDKGTSSGSNSTTQSVSAYDSTTFSPRESESGSQNGSSSTDHDHQTQTTISDKQNGTVYAKAIETSVGKDKETETENGDRVRYTKGRTDHKLYIHGNIGVTTSQQMLESELELRLYDLYEIIGDLWIDDFIVTIY